MPSEKVLIVDDEKLVRWSLRQKCEEWGYRVLEADNGAAALKVAHNESPDLVLLDVRLPDKSLIDILRLLREKALRRPRLTGDFRWDVAGVCVGLGRVSRLDHLARMAPFRVRVPLQARVESQF